MHQLDQCLFELVALNLEVEAWLHEAGTGGSLYWFILIFFPFLPISFFYSFFFFFIGLRGNC